MVETDLSETEETQGGFHAAADKMIFLGNYIEPLNQHLHGGCRVCSSSGHIFNFKRGGAGLRGSFKGMINLFLFGKL